MCPDMASDVMDTCVARYRSGGGYRSTTKVPGPGIRGRCMCRSKRWNGDALIMAFRSSCLCAALSSDTTGRLGGERAHSDKRWRGPIKLVVQMR